MALCWNGDLKSKIELPELKRCCFCIPLRYGLLTFGYIKLVVSLPVLAYFSMMLYFVIGFSMFVGWLGVEMLFIIGLFIIMLMDIVLTIVFLIGGHTKSAKLLRVYYIYSIIITCIMTCGLIVTCIIQIVNHTNLADHRGRPDQRRGYIVESSFAIYAEIITTIANVAVNTYFILLIRSEINKLRNNHNFRFSNHMSDGQCTLEHGPRENEALEQVDIGDTLRQIGDKSRQIGDKSRQIEDKNSVKIKNNNVDDAKENNFKYNKF